MRHIAIALVLTCLYVATGCRSNEATDTPPAADDVAATPPEDPPEGQTPDELRRLEELDDERARASGLPPPFGEPDGTVFTAAELGSADGLVSRIFPGGISGAVIYWADVADHGVRTTKITAGARAADWSPARDRIAYAIAHDDGARIYVAGASDEGAPTNILTEEWGHTSVLALDWHPTDEKWLAVTWADGNPLNRDSPTPDLEVEMKLHIIDEGGSIETIARLRNVIAARFSPDGGSLIVAQGPGGIIDPYTGEGFAELWRLSLTGDLEKKLADEVVEWPFTASEHGLLAVEIRNQMIDTGLIFVDTNGRVERFDLPPRGGTIEDTWVGDDEIVVAMVPDSAGGASGHRDVGEFWSTSPSAPEWRLVARYGDNELDERHRSDGRILGRCPATGALVLLDDYNHPRAIVVRGPDEPVEELLPADKIAAGDTIERPVQGDDPPVGTPLVVEGAFAAEAFHDGDLAGDGHSVHYIPTVNVASGRDDAGVTIGRKRIDLKQPDVPSISQGVYVKLHRK